MGVLADLPPSHPGNSARFLVCLPSSLTQPGAPPTPAPTASWALGAMGSPSCRPHPPEGTHLASGLLPHSTLFTSLSP